MEENKREIVSKEKYQEMVDRVLQNVKDTGSYPLFLNTLERFKRYTVDNIALIYSQKPGATKIAGYLVWQKIYGRQVKKGAKAIQIMVPVIQKNENYTDIDHKYRYAGYGKSNVFDVSDTEGQELSETDIHKYLQDNDGYDGLFKVMKDNCECPVSYRMVADEYKGIYDKATDTIMIQYGLSRKESLEALLEALSDRMANRDSSDHRDVKAQLISETIQYCARKHYGLEQPENHMNELLGKLSIKQMRIVLRNSRVRYTEFSEKTDERLTEYSTRKAIEKADMQIEAEKLAASLDAFAYGKDSYKYAINKEEREQSRQAMVKALTGKDEKELSRMFSYLQQATFESFEFRKAAADLMTVMDSYCRKYSIRSEMTKDPDIVFYAAECMEAPGMGVIKENLTLKHAIDEYEKIPTGRMNAGKGVGFELRDGSMYDGKYPLMENGVVRKDAIDIVDHYKNSYLVQNAMKECRQLIQEKNLGNKFMPDTFEISTEQCDLAQEFQNRGYDASKMEFRGRIVDLTKTNLYPDELKDLRYEVDASEINRAEFSNRQWTKLEIAKKEHADLSVLANPLYTPGQMDQVKSMMSLKKNGFLTEKQFEELSDPRVSAKEMEKGAEEAFMEYLDRKDDQVSEKPSLIGNLKEKMRYVAENTKEKNAAQDKEERS